MRVRRRIVWGLLVLVFLGVTGTIGGFYAAGYRPYVIHTGSMAPELVPGDLIIDRPADGHYRVGDVITFRHGPTPDRVTHRVVQILPSGIHTKGDANRTDDVWTIPRPYVEGVVRWTLPGVGYAAVFLKQPTGFASIVVILIGLVLLWQLFFPPQEGTDAAASDSEPTAVGGPAPEDKAPNGRALDGKAPGNEPTRSPGSRSEGLPPLEVEPALPRRHRHDDAPAPDAGDVLIAVTDVDRITDEQVPRPTAGQPAGPAAALPDQGAERHPVGAAH